MHKYTPLHITIFIHYCTGVGDFSPKSDVADEYVQQLVVDGLLEYSKKSGSVVASEKGHAHLRQICLLELPKSKLFYIDDRNRIII